MSDTQRQHARQRTATPSQPPPRPEPVEGPAATYERAQAEAVSVDDGAGAPSQPPPVAGGEGETPVAASEGDIAAEFAVARAKADEYLEQWRRTAADFANFKRRTEQERVEMGRLFNESLVKALLPALDNFERALASVPDEFKVSGWVEGVSLTEKQLRTALEKEGLSPIEALGQKFDPNLHEAVAHDISDEHEEDSVIAEFQKGYKLHDRVIRPSVVKVSRRS
ncbi:MAG TPA: nucleotide exchange factor GrpE [Chloroflexota bacterium]|nr:nucleotide exchange factor GrpE [Chloroflexota bacterium]